LNFPFVGGANITETGQSPDGAIVFMHPFLPSMKPVPVTPTTGAARSTLPLLVSMTVCGSLCVPAGTLPKFIFFVDNPTAGFFVEDEGLGCAIAKPQSADSATTTAIATAVTRCEFITR
jgi:hypothetical protein